MEKTETKSLPSLVGVISTAIQIPGVKVNRNAFLEEQFKDAPPETLEAVLSVGPVEAGCSRKELRKIACRLVQKKTLLSTGASFLAGIPGGFTMAATIPADMLQFYGVALGLAQEVSYLYGAGDLWSGDILDEEKVTNQLILYCGVMLGASGAAQTIRVLSSSLAKQALKKLPQQALTKTFYYPIIKSIAKAFGTKMTKEVFAKGVSKAVPIIGGVVSGGITFAIKPGTKVIAGYAFEGCTSLTNMAIPNSVTSIGNEAFLGCTSLISVTIPDSVTSIESGAFYQCDSLTSVTIPDSVTSIGDCAFGYDYYEVQYTTCKIPDFTIYGYKNTAAEEYASDNGFKFINLDSIKVEEPQGANHGVIKIKNKDITVGVVTEKLLNTASTNTQTFTITGNRVTAFDKNGSVITDMSIKAEEGMTFKLEKTDGTAAVYDLKLETTILGDVNGDGIIDAADAIKISRYDAGDETFTGEQLSAADVTGDGIVDAADAIKIGRYDAGLITEL